MNQFEYFLFVLIILLIPSLVSSQSKTDSSETNYQVEYNSNFDVALGSSVEFATPQKYGAAINLTFGKNNKKTVYQEEVPFREIHTIKGLNIEAGLYRGGYRFGAYYMNVGSSMIGAAGARIGMVYLKNNSFSTVLKSSNLIGIEAELYAFYKFKIGVLKALNENRYIPSIGFGFGIGPNLYN